MKELYEKTNNKGVAMKPIMYKEGYLSKLGGYLKENEVIQTLIRYCLSDPECDKYQLEKKEDESSSNYINSERYIIFIGERIHMAVFYNRTISECGDTMMTSKTQGNWVCQM